MDSRNAGRNRVPFTFLRVPRGSRSAQRMTLDLVIGPGDDDEAIVTIVLQEED